MKRQTGTTKQSALPFLTCSSWQRIEQEGGKLRALLKTAAAGCAAEEALSCCINSNEGLSEVGDRKVSIKDCRRPASPADRDGYHQFVRLSRDSPCTIASEGSYKLHVDRAGAASRASADPVEERSKARHEIYAAMGPEPLVLDHNDQADQVFKRPRSPRVEPRNDPADAPAVPSEPGEEPDQFSD